MSGSTLEVAPHPAAADSCTPAGGQREGAQRQAPPFPPLAGTGLPSRAAHLSAGLRSQRWAPSAERRAPAPLLPVQPSSRRTRSLQVRPYLHSASLARGAAPRKPGPDGAGRAPARCRDRVRRGRQRKGRGGCQGRGEAARRRGIARGGRRREGGEERRGEESGEGSPRAGSPARP